jgi:tetratricopeptide (TPR) repeat protein
LRLEAQFLAGFDDHNQINELTVRRWQNELLPVRESSPPLRDEGFAAIIGVSSAIATTRLTMRWPLIAASLLIAAMSPPLQAEDKQGCLGHKNEEQRIKACSAIVALYPNDAAAFDNRGTAYRLKGDLDLAIADYTRAIELNPGYAAAYNSRGLANASKGDYARALADVTKAGELVPNAKPRSREIKTRDAKAKPKVARAKSNATQDAPSEPPANLWPTWAPK